ncbi:hypothetical protein [Aristophania vespae]|nr:hypothetical protein [Aristophania vespae]UMM63075.1 hypothetical protein DM15PD_00290 [Aristophania vespae]
MNTPLLEEETKEIMHALAEVYGIQAALNSLSQSDEPIRSFVIA